MWGSIIFLNILPELHFTFPANTIRNVWWCSHQHYQHYLTALDKGSIYSLYSITEVNGNLSQAFIDKVEKQNSKIAVLGFDFIGPKTPDYVGCFLSSLWSDLVCEDTLTPVYNLNFFKNKYFFHLVAIYIYISTPISIM